MSISSLDSTSSLIQAVGNEADQSVVLYPFTRVRDLSRSSSRHSHGIMRQVSHPSALIMVSLRRLPIIVIDNSLYIQSISTLTLYPR